MGVPTRDDLTVGVGGLAMSVCDLPMSVSDFQCETGACIVYHLRGDPRPDCDPAQCGPGDFGCVCAPPSEVQDRVYCTCRCHDGEAEVPSCPCPGGFSCVNISDGGSLDVRGGYCIKDGTFSSN